MISGCKGIFHKMFDHCLTHKNILTLRIKKKLISKCISRIAVFHYPTPRVLFDSMQCSCINFQCLPCPCVLQNNMLHLLMCHWTVLVTGWNYNQNSVDIWLPYACQPNLKGVLPKPHNQTKLFQILTRTILFILYKSIYLRHVFMVLHCGLLLKYVPIPV